LNILNKITKNYVFTTNHVSSVSVDTQETEQARTLKYG